MSLQPKRGDRSGPSGRTGGQGGDVRALLGAIWASVAVCGVFGLWLATNGGADAWVRLVVSDGSFIVAPLLAAAACWHAARISGVHAWRWLALAMVTWAGGSVIWAFYGVMLRRPVPFPSPADLGWLGYSVPAFAALACFGATRGTWISRVRLLLDGAVIAAGLLYVSWTFVLGPLYERGLVSGFTGVVQVAYPVVDILIASMVLALGSRQPAGSRLQWALFGGGLLSLTLSDSTWVARTFEGSYAPGGLLDIGWTIAFLLIALAAMAPHGLPRPVTAVVDSPAGRLSVLQDLLPYLPVLVALVVSATTTDQSAGDSTHGDITRTIISVAMVTLVLARQFTMLVENRALNMKLEQRAEEMRHLALHDPLTRLANRTLFGDRVEHALARAARGGQPLAVLFVDLDRFKGINDAFGHAAGDELLTNVADRLAGCLRPADTLARLGGDEFAILLEDLPDDSSANAVADRLLESLQSPVAVAGTATIVQASIGIALSTPMMETADELQRNADLAMYSAKAKGRGRHATFEPTMHTASVVALGMETDLRRALRDQEFLLHYQPLTSIVTGRLTGVEALVRWQHPQRGIVAPMRFIPLAEATSLIVPLGLWVLQQACHQMSNWQRRYPTEPALTISVNVSGAQLLSEFPQTVERVLAESGIPATSLVLEITESLLMDETPEMVGVLSAVRALGVRLAIDDFGTGYSSLNRLSSLPVSILKIDKSFIDDVTDDRTSSVVAGMISMGHSLNLAVVAEGVEDVEQLTLLRRHGCDEVQGFLLARPMAPAGVEHLLAQRSPQRPGVRVAGPPAAP